MEPEIRTIIKISGDVDVLTEFAARIENALHSNLNNSDFTNISNEFHIRDVGYTDCSVIHRDYTELPMVSK